MKIMKRNGTEAAFDAQKIVVAISKARDEAACGDLSDEQIHTIAGEIKGRCEGLGYAVHVEDIQDMVEHKLIEYSISQRRKPRPEHASSPCYPR